MRLLGLLFAICIGLVACEEEVYLPKPRAYPRVTYPEKAYRPFRSDSCPFTFDYPTYAGLNKETSFNNEAPPNDCWFDVTFPDFNGSIYFSYLPIDRENTFDQLRADAFKMTDWHTKRATYINDVAFQRANVRGILSEVEGPAASPYQFFLTDSSEQHFLRGALYLNTQIQVDSLAPVYAFLKEDLDVMLESFAWE